MNKNTKILLPAALLLCAVLLYGCASASQTAETPAPETAASTAAEPSTAPTPADVLLAKDFTVYTDEGESVRLSDHFGKPIVLNFWATWCPPCQMEMPHLEEAYARYGEQVEFMLVDVTDGTEDTSETVAAFIEENGYSFPVYLDPLLDATRAYSVYSIPMTVFIDADGVISSTYVGSITAELLEERIQEILVG